MNHSKYGPFQSKQPGHLASVNTFYWPKLKQICGAIMRSTSIITFLLKALQKTQVQTSEKQHLTWGFFQQASSEKDPFLLSYIYIYIYIHPLKFNIATNNDGLEHVSPSISKIWPFWISMLNIWGADFYFPLDFRSRSCIFFDSLQHFRIFAIWILFAQTTSPAKTWWRFQPYPEFSIKLDAVLMPATNRVLKTQQIVNWV